MKRLKVTPTSIAPANPRLAAIIDPVFDFKTANGGTAVRGMLKNPMLSGLRAR